MSQNGRSPQKAAQGDLTTANYGAIEARVSGIRPLSGMSKMSRNVPLKRDSARLAADGRSTRREPV